MFEIFSFPPVTLSVQFLQKNTQQLFNLDAGRIEDARQLINFYLNDDNVSHTYATLQSPFNKQNHNELTNELMNLFSTWTSQRWKCHVFIIALLAVMLPAFMTLYVSKSSRMNGLCNKEHSTWTFSLRCLLHNRNIFIAQPGGVNNGNEHNPKQFFKCEIRFYVQISMQNQIVQHARNYKSLNILLDTDLMVSVEVLYLQAEIGNVIKGAQR